MQEPQVSVTTNAMLNWGVDKQHITVTAGNNNPIPKQHQQLLRRHHVNSDADHCRQLHKISRAQEAAVEQGPAMLFQRLCKLDGAAVQACCQGSSCGQDVDTLVKAVLVPSSHGCCKLLVAGQQLLQGTVHSFFQVLAVDQLAEDALADTAVPASP
jgi:hypothetical protein